jgi:hypothetical protein
MTTPTPEMVLWGFHPEHQPMPIALTGGRNIATERAFRERAGWTCATYAQGTDPAGLRAQASAHATDRTNGALDRAIVAYREDPTPENRARLMAASRAHVDHFHAEQTRGFIARQS